MGAINMCGRIAQNYALLDFEEGVRELANFTLAMSIYWPIHGVINFLPQMSAVMIDGRNSFRSTLAFTLGLSLGTVGVMSLFAFTETGNQLISSFFGVGESNLSVIRNYLILLLPAPPFMALSQLFMGIVIKAKSTITLTLNRALTLGSMVLVLWIGLKMGVEAKYVLSLSVLLPNVVSMLLMLFTWIWKAKDITRKLDEPKRQSELIRFYWPMALTTFMFTLSRPIIFNIVGLSPDLDTDEKQLIIAALSLAFAYGMIFHISVNQFRNVSVAFVNEKQTDVLNFMIQSTIVVTSLMVGLQILGLSHAFLENMQGAEGLLLEMSSAALWPLILVVPIVAWRNYYHGIAMNRKKTTIMGLAAIARNVMIYVVGIALLRLEVLNVISACSLILVGFATEGVIANIVVRRWQVAR